jgi:protein-tyrosine phosphatase
MLPSKRRIMIDTHAHILPGLDDGPETLQQALGLISLAVDQGVGSIIATPHCCDGVYNCDKPAILSACRDLCNAVDQAGLEIRILPGAEIRVNHDLVAQFDNGRLLTMGDAGRSLLLELPPMFITHAVFRMIRQLKERNLVPIIAHAERNPMIMAQPDLAADLIFQGARLQVTAASLTGDFGRGPLKIARTLAQNNQIFCLGSDIHPGRKYRMKAAEKKLTKFTGMTEIHKIVYGNPASLFKGCLKTDHNCQDVINF